MVEQGIDSQRGVYWILSAWRGAGLNIFNLRLVLDKLTHGLAPARARASAPPLEHPTPRYSPELHCRVRQVTRSPKSKDTDVNGAELADVISTSSEF